jgi:hypothetical protein
MGRSATLASMRIASVPSRSDQHAQQVGAIVSGAELDDRAVGQDGLDVQDVVIGDAVLQSVRTAGVFGDVSADRGQVSRHRVR